MLLRIKQSGWSLGIILNRLRADQDGQDLIEYTLIVAAVALIVAGFLPPSLMPSISTIFSKIAATLASA